MTTSAPTFPTSAKWSTSSPPAPRSVVRRTTAARAAACFPGRRWRRRTSRAPSQRCSLFSRPSPPLRCGQSYCAWRCRRVWRATLRRPGARTRCCRPAARRCVGRAGAGVRRWTTRAEQGVPARVTRRRQARRRRLPRPRPRPRPRRRRQAGCLAGFSECKEAKEYWPVHQPPPCCRN